MKEAFSLLSYAFLLLLVRNYLWLITRKCFFLFGKISIKLLQ